ncbi:hypothetical protein RU97_GL001054 [Enterococcus canis]|uniref:DUF1048 domain-containing protein n=1 Tax=Enterococcus canis TaxID=214095 RepID=A0A1L8RIC4_9ENTE|nr:DUF1048 domain-containing protein [Enterococcus canis]OJG19483.1 hypothetical protein RU97_GL001054 [Enterococcus canis]
MDIKKIVAEKQAWRAHMARVKALPEDYQIVYHEIQKYLFKVVPTNTIDILIELQQLFEEGANNHKSVLEITGPDVAAFVDGMIDEETADQTQKIVDEKVAESMRKWLDKK